MKTETVTNENVETWRIMCFMWCVYVRVRGCLIHSNTAFYYLFIFFTRLLYFLNNFITSFLGFKLRQGL